MAKHRKTRKQKVHSDVRRKMPPVAVTNTAYSFSPSKTSSQTTPDTKTVSPIRTHAISTISYQFLTHDLRKTLLLTGSIIVFQLILFSLTRNI